VLDAIRIELATQLFQAAGQSRALLAGGDRDPGLEALSRSVWLDAWEHAVTEAGEAVADRLRSAFEAAALESRMPPRLLASFVPTEPERRAIKAHLGKGTGRLEQALDTLDEAAAGAGKDPDQIVAWTAAVDLCARRVEAAWADLLEAVDHEEQRWRVEIETVRAWRRPRWPLWVLTSVVVVVAVYLGLVAGGILMPPAFLSGWADFWWERL
jgi:hypothetical protein